MTIGSRRHSFESGANAHVSLASVLINWAALVALWALPYLALLDYLRLDAAQSEVLQWTLVAVGASGLASLLYTAWRQTRDPAWRAHHGYTTRAR